MPMHQHLRDQLIDRLRPGTPYREHFSGLIHASYNTSARLESERQRLAADSNFSDTGRRNELAKIIRETMVADLSELTRSYRIAKGGNAGRRAALKLPDIDKTDQVSELRRQEMRSFIRSHPEAKRPGVCAELMAENPEAAAAVLSAPGALTGLPRQYLDDLRRQELRRHHGKAIDTLDEEMADIEQAGAAVEMAFAELQRASGLDPHEFAALAKLIQDQTDKERA